MSELDTYDLTDSQYEIVHRARQYPALLRDGAEKTSAAALQKKGWGQREHGASGDLIFRLNQAGEDAVSREKYT